MADRPFVWKGKDLKKLGDIGDAISEIIKLPDAEAKAEAKSFMDTYRASVDEPEIVSSNIGYITGYYDVPEMKRIQEIFLVVHPVFGSAVPTPEQAFAAGLKIGGADRG
jgi:hypothetical protein